MNYWYSARPNEIFLDLDSNRAIARALSVLRVAIRKKQLDIKGVWLYGTPTKGHAHLIIVLRYAVPWAVNVAWGLWMGNDRLRAAYVLARREIGSAHCDLLVTQGLYYRQPDAFCECKEKHKPKKVTDKCPAMIHLLRDERSADYFSRTGSVPPRKKIRVPWGKVSLVQIRNWKEIHEERKERLRERGGNVDTVRDI
jgi:hypothetical protein